MGVYRMSDSIAEIVARDFGWDRHGLGAWGVMRGTTTEGYCEQHCALTSSRPDSTRYIFDDGSSIVFSGDSWDLGHSWPCTCHCRPADLDGGHVDGCPSQQGRVILEWMESQNEGPDAEWLWVWHPNGDPDKDSCTGPLPDIAKTATRAELIDAMREQWGIATPHVEVLP